MKRSKWYFTVTFALAAFVLLAGCPADDSDVEGPTRDRPNIDKVALNDKVVKNHLYIEVNNTDPRVALGYVLADSKTPFFDHVVIFASNIKVNEQGEVVVYHNGNVQHLYANRSKYIKPLQDKGIKVLLGILGGWGGVSPGTLGDWPLGPSNPGAADGYTWPSDYPYGPDKRTRFLTAIKDEIDRLGLDGVDFDDEWCSKSFKIKGDDVYPGTTYYSGYDVQRDAWIRGGKIFADLLIECREILGPDKIISLYEWHYGQYVPLSVEKDGKTIYMKDIIDYSTEAAYGSWMNDSYMGSGFPRAQYAPVGIDIGGGDANIVRPGPTSIGSEMGKYLSGGYGYNIFYSLSSQEDYTKRPNFFGALGTVEKYLSLISQTIYGEDVIYIGRDYPKDWTASDD